MPKDEIITNTVTVEVPNGTNRFKPFVIEADAFNGKGLKELVIKGKGVIEFQARCFENCTELRRVTFSKDIFVLEFYVNSFAKCSSLTTIDYTYEGEYTKEERSTIGINAFAHCIQLKKINFVGSAILHGAFFQCHALEKIVPLGETKLTVFKEAAFEGCGNLSLENLRGGQLDNLKTIRPDTFKNCPKIFRYVGQTMDTFPPEAEDVFVFSAVIPESAFSGKNIKFVHFQPGLFIEIGKKAFFDCKSLERVSLGRALSAEIGESAFEGCSALETVSFPPASKSIGKKAFRNCTNLSGELKLPDRLMEIQEEAFQWTSISSVELSLETRSIGSRAFEGTNKLTTIKVRIPGIQVKSCAFHGAKFTEWTTQISEDDIAKIKKNSQTVEIGTYIDDDSVFLLSLNGKRHIEAEDLEEDEEDEEYEVIEYDIGEGLRRIYEEAFEGTYFLEVRARVPPISVGPYAFLNSKLGKWTTNIDEDTIAQLKTTEDEMGIGDLIWNLNAGLVRENEQEENAEAAVGINTVVMNKTNLWIEIARRLGYGNPYYVKDVAEAFLMALGVVIPQVKPYLKTILEETFSESSTTDIHKAFELGNDWKFHVSSGEELTLYFTKNEMNEFPIPSLASIFNALNTITGESMNVYLPDVIANIGKGVKVQTMSLDIPPFQMPSISMDVVNEFDRSSVLAENLGLEEIRLSHTITLGRTLNFESSLSLVVGEMRLIATVPEDKDAPWHFRLDTTGNKVSLGSLRNSVRVLDNLEDTGILSLTNLDAIVSDLNIEIDGGKVETFTFGVASSFPALGNVEFENSIVTMVISKPFDRANREFFLGIRLDMQIGPNIGPIGCYGSLSRESGSLEGEIGASIEGDVRVNDIFDVSQEDMALEIDGFGSLDVDRIGEISFSNPSIVLQYEEDKFSVEFSSNNMRVKVGGAEQLEANISIPVADYTANVLDEIGLEYSKKSNIKTFYTDLQVQDNDIEKGLKLLGDKGKEIIKKEELRFSIEKRRKKTKFYFPTEDIIPDEIDLGDLKLTEMNGYISPMKKGLCFGFEGKLELELFSDNKIILEGELDASPIALSGILAFVSTGGIKIGKHIKMDSFAIEFGFNIVRASAFAGGKMDFSLFDLEDVDTNTNGTFELLMAMTTTAPPLPYPQKIILLYPDELSIKGILDVFLGEGTVNLPEEIGRIFTIRGPLENGGHDQLKVEFDITEVYFALECYVSFFGDTFAGQIVGELDIEKGIKFDAQLKAIDYGFVKVTGTKGLSGEQLESRRLLRAERKSLQLKSSELAEPTSSASIVPLSTPSTTAVTTVESSSKWRSESDTLKSFSDVDPRFKVNATRDTDFEAFVDCAVSLLGMEAAAYIDINATGFEFWVKGNLFNVFLAEVYAIMKSSVFSVEVWFEQRFVQNLDRIVKEFVEGFVDMIEKAWEFAQETAKNIGEAVKKLGKELEKKKEELTKFIAEKAQQIKEVADYITNELNNKIQDLKNKVKVATEKAKEFWDAAKGAIQDRLNDARNAIARLGKQIKTRLEYVLKNLENLRNVTVAARKAFDSAVQEVKSALTNVDAQRRVMNIFGRNLKNKKKYRDSLSRWNPKRAIATTEVNQLQYLYNTAKMSFSLINSQYGKLLIARSDRRTDLFNARRRQDKGSESNDLQLKRHRTDMAAAEQNKANVERELKDGYSKFDPSQNSVVRLEQQKLYSANQKKKEEQDRLNELRNQQEDGTASRKKQREEKQNEVKEEKEYEKNYLAGEYKEASNDYEGDVIQDFIKFRGGTEASVSYVGQILNIKNIYFRTELSASRGVEVEVEVKYNFLGESENEMRFMFTFSQRDAADASGEVKKFAREIAKSMMNPLLPGIQTTESVDIGDLEGDAESIKKLTTDFEGEYLRNLVKAIDSENTLVTNESKNLKATFDGFSKNEYIQTKIIALELTTAQSFFDTQEAQSLNEGSIAEEFRLEVAELLNTLSTLDDDMKSQSNSVETVMTEMEVKLSQSNSVKVNTNSTDSMKEKIIKWNKSCDEAKSKLEQNVSVFSANRSKERHTLYKMLDENVERMTKLEDRFDEHTDTAKSQVRALEESVMNGDESLYPELRDKRRELLERVEILYSLDYHLRETKKSLEERKRIEDSYSERAESEARLLSAVALRPIEFSGKPKLEIDIETVLT